MLSTVLLIVLGILVALVAVLVAGAISMSRSGYRPGDLYDHND